MKKYSLKDIEIKTPGLQLRDKIIDKYGSISNFANEINLYESSINQYLFNKDLGSSTFKIRTAYAFNEDFNKLFLSENEQIRIMTSTISWYIQDYNQYQDINIFEKLKKICLEKELMEDYAIVCRCFAHFYWNQGKRDRGLAYIEVAANIMRNKDNIDRFGLYLSEYLWMKVAYFKKSIQSKELNEFDKTIEKVQGPLTTGYMYYNLANAFSSIKNYDKSKYYYLKSLKYHEAPKIRAFIYMSYGDMQKEMGLRQEALQSYKSAEALLDDSDDSLSYVYHEYALYYYEIGDMIKAENYIDLVFKGEKLLIASTDNDFLVTFCKIKLQQNKVKEALYYIEQLLSEIEGEYIYLENHLLKLDNLIDWQKDNRQFLDIISGILIKHYKLNEKKLSSEIKRILKMTIGNVFIHLAYLK